jgi:hypothetical protein
VRFAPESAVGSLALALSLVLLLALSGCGGLAQLPGVAARAATPGRTPSPLADTPTATRPATATSTPRPATPTPLPATPTPPARLPLTLQAQLDPPTPRAGDEFVVALSITNDGERAARGVYLATTGPWDRWTVLGVEPAGTFDRDAAGWHIISPIDIPPHETRTLEVHVRAEEPTEEQLTFAVREADPSELP